MEKNIPIGQILLNNGMITENQLNRALEFQKMTPQKRIGEILIELGYVTEKDVLESVAHRMGATYVDLLGYSIDPNAVALVPHNFAVRNTIVPIDFKNDSLVIATSDALDFYLFEELAMLTGMEVSIVLSERENIITCIEKAYSQEQVTSAAEDVNAAFDNVLDDEWSIISDRIEGTPIVKMVNTLIRQAYAKGASDIHIEPGEKVLNVRFRLNGDLILHTSLKMAAHNPILTRLKIMGGMNIAEKRIPQDGKYRYQLKDEALDLRISTLPTIFGEKAVLRLLGGNQKRYLLDMKRLGMQEDQYDKFQQILKKPNGIILVTGPTGSGKTTTLYAAIGQALKRNINIITVEDPVEKVMEGATQVQVNNKAGLTYAAALRSILRQDPDVIMVGEMRDSETASIGVRAAITGHQVLSTLHTNDCASSIVRLVDMGVPSYLVAASLSGIVAQRLVKRLCPHCKEEYQPEDTDLPLFLNKGTKQLWKAVGCVRCNFTGYQDRIAVYEIMDIDRTLSDMIAKDASVNEIRTYAKEKGNLTLRESVTKLVLSGETTLEEMEKIIFSVE